MMKPYPEEVIPLDDQENPVDLYEFRIKNHLEPGWFRMFPGMEVKNIESGEALITGRLASQTAIYEVLERIQSLNLTLISVQQIVSPAG